MNIGQTLKAKRLKAELAQEHVAETIGVSRQTISNWENEKSYPDIASVIKLSDLYKVSLDELLKGDEKMMEHIKESTDLVSGSKKLIAVTIVNLLVLTLLIAASFFIPDSHFFLAGVFTFAIIVTSLLLYNIVKRI